jgi:AraC-like DNA-binding protein
MSRSSNAVSKTIRPQRLSARQVLQVLGQKVPWSSALVLSTLPRGTLNITQPAEVSESLVKSYAAEIHRVDRLAWQALRRGQALRATDVWPADLEVSSYYQTVMKPLGAKHLVAAPLAGPIFAGYPGVVCLGRAADESSFSDEEVAELGAICAGVVEGVATTARRRAAEDPCIHRARVRFLVFDRDGQLVFPSEVTGLDERLEQQFRQRVRQCMDHLANGHRIADRILLPDTWGDLWVFRCVVHPEYPALAAGPVVVFTLQPEAAEWVSVRPVDVEADPETVRLLPSLRFMDQRFHTNPTLGDISTKAHLSPFHFHRRFTDLIGQTPKHFLLSCQVCEAKRMLVARKRELARIAVDCGFAHQSHFTSRFKQATGLTPTRWRRISSQLAATVPSN